jgi:ADP-ribosyltransferase exoenzyme
MTAAQDESNARRVWLNPLLQIVRRTDAELKRLLEKTAKAAAGDVLRINRDNIGDVVRRGQLRLAQAAAKRALGSFWKDAGNLIQAERLEVVAQALEASFDVDESIFKAAGISKKQRTAMRSGLLAAAERNIDNMVRRFTTQQHELSAQVYRTEQLANGGIDRLVNHAIGRGLSAKELADEVKRYIKPDVPGGVSYAALRLARTELNNAFHAASIADASDKPWVNAMDWHLSESHPRPDECDDLAGDDQHGLGKGVFPVAEVPGKPHPHCFCFVTPKVIDEDQFIEQFLQDVPPEPPADEARDVAIAERKDIKPNKEQALRLATTKAELAATKPGDPRYEARTQLEAQHSGLFDLDREVRTEERRALKRYTSGEYRQINVALRRGSVEELESGLQETIKRLDDLGKITQATQDLVVFRGINGEALRDLQVGDMLHDDGFVSATTDPGQARLFGARFFQISVRKGSSAIKPPDALELEWIIPRGSNFKITEITKENIVKMVLL